MQVLGVLRTCLTVYFWLFFFSSRRRHTRLQGDWSSDVCSSDLVLAGAAVGISLAVTGKSGSSSVSVPTRGSLASAPLSEAAAAYRLFSGISEHGNRSEERRVGKEGRSRWSPYH